MFQFVTHLKCGLFCLRHRANTDTWKSLKQFKKVAWKPQKTSKLTYIRTQPWGLTTNLPWIFFNCPDRKSTFLCVKKAFVLEHFQCENLVVIVIMLVGLCPRGAKIFGAISLSPVVPAVCFGIVGPLQRRVRAFATITTLQSFCKIIRQSALWIWNSYIMVYTSYRKQLLSYHHHKGYEISCTP